MFSDSKCDKKKSPLYVFDRETKSKIEEKVYGQRALNLLYGGGKFGSFIKELASKNPFVSAFYGWLQKRPSSKKKVVPFIKLFAVDCSEFVKAPADFSSFNDFFIRHLKPESRPLADTQAICPADGRYRFFPNIKKSEGFWVKGEKFNLKTFLDDAALAEKFDEGSLVLARLCPSDYHRFHFPVSCTPSETKMINGWLYSVNPVALTQDIHIYTKNKRALTHLKDTPFGEVLMVEIGATNVGSIEQTFTPGIPVQKGDEKGYFEFGASAVALIFAKDRLHFDPALLAPSDLNLEIKCLMGQSLSSNSVN